MDCLHVAILLLTGKVASHAMDKEHKDCLPSSNYYKKSLVHRSKQPQGRCCVVRQEEVSVMTMMMSRLWLTSLLLMLLVFNHLSAAQDFSDGGCRQVSTSESSSGNGATSNRLNVVGGLSNIDKITKINVKWGIYTCFLGAGAEVVTEMTVTYRRKDNGKPVDIKFGNGGGCNRGEFTVAFDEDEYLTGVDNFEGNYMDYITLYTTKQVYGPYGGGSNSPNSTPKFRKSRSVIKAFKWKAGDVVDRLGVYYETDHVLKRIASPPIAIQPVDDGVVPSQPQKVYEHTNNGSTSITHTFELALEVTKKDSVTLSEESTGSVDLTFSAGIDIKGIHAGREFSIGYSVTESISKTTETEETETITDTREYDILPGTTAILYFSIEQVEYSYSFTGPVKCVYSFAPDTEEDGGGDVGGRIEGSLGFTETQKVRVEEIGPTTTESTNGSSDSPGGTSVNTRLDESSQSSRHSGGLAIVLVVAALLCARLF